MGELLDPGKLLLILGVGLVVFGPKKLPEIGRNLGKALRDLYRARDNFMAALNEDIEREAALPAPAADGALETTAVAAGPVAEPAPGTFQRPVKRIEYPEPLPLESADALPYGLAPGAAPTQSVGTRHPAAADGTNVAGSA